MLLSSKEHSRRMAQKWDGSSPNYILQLRLKKKKKTGAIRTFALQPLDLSSPTCNSFIAFSVPAHAPTAPARLL